MVTRMKYEYNTYIYFVMRYSFHHQLYYLLANKDNEIN